MPADVAPLAPPPPPAPPIDTPEGLSPDAWFAFRKMIKACGKTSFRMPTSCELFLRQHMSKFETERDLLTVAMKVGVPEHIMSFKGEGYAEYLVKLTAEFVEVSGLPADRAKWAVEAWAVGVGRPPGTELPPPVARMVEPGPGAPPPVGEKGLQWIMAGIAGAGGFVGGALGNGIGLVLLLTDVVVDANMAGKSADAGTLAVIALVVVMMLMGGMAGGLGAFAGWMFGKGNEKPWAGFSAACGAAFGTACLLFFCVGPGLITAGAMMFSAFGAAFTAAARGGFRH